MKTKPPVRLTLDKVVVRVVQIPMRRPIVARLGEFKSFPYILTDVHTNEGVIGHSYLEPYRVTAAKSIVGLIEDMAEQQRGKPVAPFDRFGEAMRSLHLLGRQGVTLIAIAAMDMAMWDALAKASGLPLVVLLGGTVGPVRAYNTNGLWLIPIERLADEASALVAEGEFTALKIRLGRDTAKDDLKAIAEVRRAVGDDIILMGDFNQGLSFRPPRTISELRCAGERRVELGASGFRIEANTCIPDGMIDEDAIRYRWDMVGSKLDERGRRMFAAGEVRTAGRGGLAVVSRITGLARSTINRGEDDLDGEELPKGQVRRAGAGRKAVAARDPGLVPALKRLLEPATLGDPMRPLLWVSKSMDKLAAILTAMGHPISADTVRKELVKLGFSRQYNRKAEEGSKHPDRNAQFDHINAKVVTAQAKSQPIISVDTKKKELVGNFRNGGSDYRPKGDPLRVKVHDFEDKDLGKVVPYGVYDVTANAGFVSVGITSDTAQFAVQSIRTWLARMGRERYPDMKELTITADCGGSNGARVRLWKIELQKLADDTNLTLSVHHYPPGTSKWNRIEHRLFCHITQNWRGRPLTDRIAVVELIGATTTKAGLKVECALDERTYEKGIKVRDTEMDALDITGDAFHPEWNYTIKPRQLAEL